MTSLAGTSISSTSFLLLKKVRQKRQDNGNQGGKSKTPKRINDSVQQQHNEQPKPLTISQTLTYRQKMVQSYLRPQSTKSINYGNQQSAKKDQFDKYFKPYQYNYSGESGQKISVQKNKSRSLSKDQTSSKVKDIILKNYNAQYYSSTMKVPISTHNSQSVNRSLKILQPSLYSSVDGYQQQSSSINYASEQPVSKTRSPSEINKIYYSGRSQSRTPDRVINYLVKSPKGSVKQTPRKKSRDDINSDQFRFLNSTNRTNESKSKNFSSCHILDQKIDPNQEARDRDLDIQLLHTKSQYNSIRNVEARDIEIQESQKSNENLSYDYSRQDISPKLLKQDSKLQKLTIDPYQSTSAKNYQSNYSTNDTKIDKKPKNSTVKQIRPHKDQSSIKKVKKIDLTSEIKTENKPNLNGLITKVKKGQILPFQTPNIKLKKQSSSNSTTPSTQKSTTPTKVPEIIEAKNDVSTYMQGIFQPLFSGCKYYQTALLHFHYETLYKKQSPFHLQFQIAYKTEDYYEYIKGVYEEHFIQSFFSLRYCATIPARALSEIQPKMVYLPQHKTQNYKRTIVFDLDETLIHCNDSNDDPCDFKVKIDFPQSETIQACINIRPYCKEVLSVMKDHFELIVFTASHQCYAEAVLSRIDPNKSIFKHRFFRDSCVQAGDGLYIKDLRVIGNRQLQDMLLVDNAAYSFCHQLDNGVPIIPFYDNKADQELLYLAQYLINLQDKKNWIQLNKENFSMLTYQKTQNTEECLKSLVHREF